MFEDVTKSVKASLYDKVSSPLFGAFSISWSAWNYKLLLTLFSSIELQNKINNIESILYPEFQIILLTGFIYPLITSVLFILIYPIPAKYIYKYWHSQQIQLKEIKQKIEDKTPLTVEESRTIRREILSLESQYETELNRRGSENDRLRELVRELEDNLLNETKNRRSDSGSSVKADAEPKKPEIPVKYIDSKNSPNKQLTNFEKYLASGKLDNFIRHQRRILTESSYAPDDIGGSDAAKAFGLIEQQGGHVKISKKGREFFEWLLLKDDR